MQEPLIIFNDHTGMFEIRFGLVNPDEDTIDAISEPIVAFDFKSMEDALSFAKKLYDNIRDSFLFDDIIKLSEVED